ncbi:flavin reductase family protein [Streptomyces stramineus]|uniref:Flavin reductase family protein n=1 Tax=Streptomyces stramineus TaxID=173861 RepID=A0ABN0ZW52_9ACTN
MTQGGQVSDLVTVRPPAAAPDGPHAMEPSTLRYVMSQFATGVTVLTVGGEHLHGMTANAFSSVSLASSSVLCCVDHSAVMHDSIVAAGHFAVSIMESGQEGLARYFADKKRPLGPAQFEEVAWAPGPRTGAPLLSGALAWLECEVTASHVSGDHSIFIGTVLGSSRGPGSKGLLFFDGAFHEGAARVR